MKRINHPEDSPYVTPTMEDNVQSAETGGKEDAPGNQGSGDGEWLPSPTMEVC
jgi:hypothetical protein